jgi:Zn-dependent metalloprotease
MHIGFGRRFTVVAGILAALATAAAAQDVKQDVQKAIDQARRANPDLNVRVDSVTGLPTSIKGLQPQATPSANLGAGARSLGPAPNEGQVRSAVESFFSQSQLSAAFPSGNQGTKVEALKIRNDPDIPGQSVVHVEQRVNGIPVFGSTGKVTVNPSLAVTKLTANFSAVSLQSTTPTITEVQAIATAMAQLKVLIASRSSRDRSIETLRANVDAAPVRSSLIVYDPALMRARGARPGTARLAHLVVIDTFHFFVDAETNSVLFYYRDSPSAGQRQVFDLNKGMKFPGKRTIDEVGNERVEPVPTDAEHAFANTGRVHLYFKSIFDRPGISDNPQAANKLESYVRFGDVQNAYWCKVAASFCPKGGVMVYGPGFAGALDVVGHEMTHGIITEEADLIYADEPGAVNEALSDLFGTLIEFHANNGDGNWVLGEQLPGFSITQPLRSMANPPLMGEDGKKLFDKSKPFDPKTNFGQPDHYGEYVKREDQLCESTSDFFSGCVHFNSGILNKFAFLISEGGIHHGVTVHGIGREKLGRIAFRALTTHMTQTTGLAQAAETFVNSCEELATAGVGGLAATDCDQVENAMHATGLAPAS